MQPAYRGRNLTPRPPSLRGKGEPVFLPSPKRGGAGEGFFMPTEREKMLAGELYDPLDPELVAARARARDLCWDLNATRESQADDRRRILRQLLGAGGDTVWMQPPFFCDYGF